MVMKQRVDNTEREEIVLVPGTKAAALFNKLLQKDTVLDADLEKVKSQLDLHDKKRLEYVGLINALTGAKPVTQDLLDGYIIDVSQESIDKDLSTVSKKE